MPCLHWWIPRLGLKLGETGKIPSKTKKVIIIFWGILCRGNIVITWSRCASNLPSLDLWLFPVSCSFLGRRLNQDQLQWGPSRKCRHGAYMLDTLGPRPLSISSSKKQITFKILYILVKQGIVRVNPTQSQISDGDLIRKKEDAKKIAKLIKKMCGQYWNGKKTILDELLCWGGYFIAVSSRFFWSFELNDLWSKKICRLIKTIVWSGATFILRWSCFLFLPEFQHLPFQKIGSAQLCFKTSIIWRQTFWFTDKLIFANIRDPRKSRMGEFWRQCCGIKLSSSMITASRRC